MPVFALKIILVTMLVISFGTTSCSCIGCIVEGAKLGTQLVVGATLHGYEEAFGDESSAITFCQRDDGSVFYYTIFRTCLKNNHTKITKEKYHDIKYKTLKLLVDNKTQDTEVSFTPREEQILELKLDRLNEMEKNKLITKEIASTRRSKIINDYVDN